MAAHEAAWFVGRVTVNGSADPPNVSQLISASRLELGQDFTEDYLLQSSSNIIALMRANGLYGATMDPRFEYEPLTQQVNVTFNLKHGPRARFTRPVITGTPGQSDGAILWKTRWKRLWGLAGYKQATESRVQTGLERVRYSFQARDFLMAKVALEKLAYLPETNEVGVKQVLVVNKDHPWWGTAVYGGPYLDRIEYIDLGTDPSAVVAAAEADEIDVTYQTVGDFVGILDGLGWNKSEAVTSATIAVRWNQGSDLYKDVKVRKGMQLAVNNATILELGYANLGKPAENHHVCPIHPEYAELPPLVVDAAAGKALVAEAGHADTEFELISIDDAWMAATCDAVAAQLRDAGINIKRTILPGSTFWNDWLKYPFSATEWNMRPLGVQILALAYKTGVAWNESAFSNAEFDKLLGEANAIADNDKRREVMAKIEKILQDEGVMIQPYWRSLYRHFKANVKGADMHPTFEHHHYKWSMDA